MTETSIPTGPEPGEGWPAQGDCTTPVRHEFEAARAREDGGADPGLLRELAARDRRLAELESACKAAVRDRELATALVGRTLVKGAASQLLKLWREEFDVFEGDGEFRVSARDGRTVAQAVTDWLASPDYSHFCLPTSKGGAGARDASRPQGQAAAASPKNLGEMVVMRWREESAARSESGLKPIGLRRGR